MFEGRMLERARAENLLELIQAYFFADIELDEHQHRAVQDRIGPYRLTGQGTEYVPSQVVSNCDGGFIVADHGSSRVTGGLADPVPLFSQNPGSLGDTSIKLFVSTHYRCRRAVWMTSARCRVGRPAPWDICSRQLNPSAIMSVSG